MTNLPVSVNLYQLFWSHVRKSFNCWEWEGYKDTDGYGTLTYKRKKYRAARFSYLISTGPIPKGLCVLHRCDNPSCVRPSHLYVGTYKQNGGDMVDRDRSPRGERHGASKLTEEIVKWMRAAYVPRHPELGRTALAKRFGVTVVTISRAINGECWGHVD